MRKSKLDEIRENHEERKWADGKYNSKIDYSKEAYQQHHEIEYLLLLIDSIEELAHVEIGKASRKAKAKRTASR